jgi:hypothetical protein
VAQAKQAMRVRLIDTDNDGNANLAVCARISNNANGSIFQVGGAGAADVYLCNDTKSDRCAKQVTQVLGAGKGATTCSITTTTPDGIAGGEDGADITATCSIDLGMQGLAGTTSRDLLNVCSFPSGEPNSNPFDCVVKVGAAFIQIVKATDVTSTDLFGFTLSIPATDGSSKYKVQAGVTTALLPGDAGHQLRHHGDDGVQLDVVERRVHGRWRFHGHKERGAEQDYRNRGEDRPDDDMYVHKFRCAHRTGDLHHHGEQSHG